MPPPLTSLLFPFAGSCVQKFQYFSEAEKSPFFRRVRVSLAEAGVGNASSRDRVSPASGGCGTGLLRGCQNVRVVVFFLELHSLPDLCGGAVYSGRCHDQFVLLIVGAYHRADDDAGEAPDRSVHSEQIHVQLLTVPARYTGNVAVVDGVSEGVPAFGVRVPDGAIGLHGYGAFQPEPGVGAGQGARRADRVGHMRIPQCVRLLSMTCLIFQSFWDRST